MKVSFKLAEAHLKKRIAEKVGVRAKELVGELHEEILKRTPFNTGRTLGSWVVSIQEPKLIDIALKYGQHAFEYDPDMLPATNKLHVGDEGPTAYGISRKAMEDVSRETLKKINFTKDPYQIYYIANGAEIDSGFGIGGLDSLPSGIKDGPGSRFAALNYGQIAGYDVYASFKGHANFIFDPRGKNALERAVQAFRNNNTTFAGG